MDNGQGKGTARRWQLRRYPGLVLVRQIGRPPILQTRRRESAEEPPEREKGGAPTAEAAESGEEGDVRRGEEPLRSARLCRAPAAPRPAASALGECTTTCEGKGEESRAVCPLCIYREKRGRTPVWGLTTAATRGSRARLREDKKEAWRLRVGKGKKTLYGAAGGWRLGAEGAQPP